MDSLRNETELSEGVEACWAGNHKECMSLVTMQVHNHRCFSCTVYVVQCNHDVFKTELSLSGYEQEVQKLSGCTPNTVNETKIQTRETTLPNNFFNCDTNQYMTQVSAYDQLKGEVY